MAASVSVTLRDGEGAVVRVQKKLGVSAERINEIAERALRAARRAAKGAGVA